MPINVNHPEANGLTRRFATMVGVGITGAIVIAVRKAIERRHGAETPRATAARLRAQHGITLGDTAREPLPREVCDALWGRS